MLRYIHKYFTSIPPVFLDGTLYAAVAWMIYNQGYFGGDEAAKYLEPETKFWINWVVGSLATVCGAIKMFRSTAFAEHQESKKDVNNLDPNS